MVKRVSETQNGRRDRLKVSSGRNARHGSGMQLALQRVQSPQALLPPALRTFSLPLLPGLPADDKHVCQPLSDVATGKTGKLDGNRRPLFTCLWRQGA
jgi:hypothetical protein